MAISAVRAARIRKIQALKSKGLKSPAIAKRLNLSPSTVRDYINDPYRTKARLRQRRYAVEGIAMPAGGTEIVSVKGPTKTWHPHRGEGRGHNLTRGKQMQAVTGYYARRG